MQALVNISVSSSIALLPVPAVIFVVDSSNPERLEEAKNELVKLVQEKELKEASLLIFANKQVWKLFFLCHAIHVCCQYVPSITSIDRIKP